MCVITAGRRLIGKINNTETQKVRRNYGNQYVFLEGAYELRVQHTRTAAGLGVEMIPVPIAPWPGRSNIITKVDTIFRVDRLREMADMEKMMDSMSKGPSGEVERRSGRVVIPGSSPMSPEELAEMDRRLRGQS